MSGGGPGREKFVLGERRLSWESVGCPEREVLSWKRGVCPGREGLSWVSGGSPGREEFVLGERNSRVA